MPQLRGQRPKLIELRDVDESTFSDETPIVKKQGGEAMFGGAPNIASGGSGLTTNRFKTLAFTNAPAPMEFGINIGAGAQPVVLRGDMNAAQIKAAFEASSDLAGYAVGVKGSTSTAGATIPGVPEVQTYTFANFMAMDGVAVGFNSSSYYDLASATNWGAGTVNKTAIQNGLNALPEFSNNPVTVSGTISYDNSDMGEYEGTLILTFTNTAPVASLVKLINPMMMDEMGNFTRTTTGAGPSATQNKGDDGELLFSGQFTVFLTGSTPYPAWGVVKNSEVQKFVVTAGDGGNYTLNGGANFTLGVSAATLQANQRALGGSCANVVVKGLSDNGSGGDATDGRGAFATASSVYVAGPHDAANAFDNSTSGNVWHSSPGTMPQWIAIDLGSTKTLGSYRMYIQADQYPITWTLQGSSTGAFTGEEVIADTRTGVSPTVNAWNAYTLATPAAFRYWRLHVTTTQGGSVVKIVEIEMLTATIAIANFNSYFPFITGNIANPTATGTGASVSTLVQGAGDSAIVVAGEVSIDELLWSAVP